MPFVRVDPDQPISPELVGTIRRFIGGVVPGDRVMIVTTAGCGSWLHEHGPRLEGVRGTVAGIWRDDLAPDDAEHKFYVEFDSPGLRVGFDDYARLMSSSFTADELQRVKHDEEQVNDG